MHFSGIRTRLVVWNLAVLALILAVTVAAAIVSIVREHRDAVDDDLHLVAAKEILRFHNGEGSQVPGVRDIMEMLLGEDHELSGAGPVLAFQIDPNGLISGAVQVPMWLPDQAAVAIALRGSEVQSERDVDGVAARLLTVPVRKDHEIVGAVQVVKPLMADQRELSRTILTLVATGVVGLIVALAGSYFLAGRAMKPIEEAFHNQRRFIADASHELRTPAAVIHARAQILSKEWPTLPTGAKEQVESLQADTEEFVRLLNVLLDLARLDGGGEEIVIEPVPVAEAVEETARQLMPLSGRRSIALSCRCEHVWALANLGRVRQILRALVDNALNHTPVGGHVVLETDREGGWARMRVRDDGEGIAPEHLPNIFARFYRTDASRSRGMAGGGAGLGLAIASQLVSRMNGQMRVDSVVDRGTTVTVLLPLAAPAASLDEADV